MDVSSNDHDLWKESDLRVECAKRMATLRIRNCPQQVVIDLERQIDRVVECALELGINKACTIPLLSVIPPWTLSLDQQVMMVEHKCLWGNVDREAFPYGIRNAPNAPDRPRDSYWLFGVSSQIAVNDGFDITVEEMVAMAIHYGMFERCFGALGSRLGNGLLIPLLLLSQRAAQAGEVPLLTTSIESQRETSRIYQRYAAVHFARFAD